MAFFFRYPNNRHLLYSTGRPEDCSRAGHGRPPKGGGGVGEMGFMPGPLFCVAGVGDEGPGTQILARKSVSTKNCSLTDVGIVGIMLSHICWRDPAPPKPNLVWPSEASLHSSTG